MNAPADRIWEMSVADIFLTLRPPKKEDEPATTRTAQKLMLLDLQMRHDLLDKLSWQDRTELEELIAEYT